MGPYSGALISFTAYQTGTLELPYDFQPVTITTPTTPPLLPDFTSVPFINAVGSYAVTLFSLMDTFSWLAILVVLLLAARALWWLYHFVTEQTPNAEVNLSGAFDSMGDVTGNETYTTAAKAVRRSKNPFR